MNFKLTAILFAVLCLFSFAMADQYDTGCIARGEDGSSEFCTECQKGYTLSNYACVECTLYNGPSCKACSDLYICDECSAGFVLEDGSCVPEGYDLGCAEYGDEFCDVCKSGYVLANYACVPCDLYNGVNCLECSTIYECSECAEGSSLSNGKCVSDDDSTDNQQDNDSNDEDEDGTDMDTEYDVGCAEYGEEFCAVCEKGYSLVNFQCVECTLYNGENCTACNGLYACTECADGYMVRAGKCIANEYDVGCEVYGDIFCDVCKTGYALVNYQCVECTLYNGENCTACDGLYNCTDCAEGFSVEDGACVANN